MILVHQEILKLIERGIVDAKPEDVQAASIDVHLSNDFLVEAGVRNMMVDPCRGDGPTFQKIEGKVLLSPGEFALASIAEYLNLPSDIGAEFRLCSTVARCGIGHALAVWIDPGYSGNITLELKNELKYHSAVLVEGGRIGQLIFHKCNPTDAPYHGAYNGIDRTFGATRH